MFTETKARELGLAAAIAAICEFADGDKRRLRRIVRKLQR